VDVGPLNPASGYRPGAVSTFFVYKAGLFALGFWGWLAHLAFSGSPLSGWHIVAATGAATTTLVGVILGVRIALARSAASRHEQLMRSLVEISWYTFAKAPADRDLGRDVEGVDGDASVIRLSQESRPRPRR